MIYNCGPTWEEVKRRRAEWHDFFPLFPRVVLVVNGERRCAWFQTIQRRSTWYSRGWDPGDWSNEYRLKPSDASQGKE